MSGGSDPLSWGRLCALAIPGGRTGSRTKVIELATGSRRVSGASWRAAAAWGYPRLRGTARGGLALFLAPGGLAAVYYTRELGLSSDDVSGLGGLLAGATLLALGGVTLWRTRRRDGWFIARRLGLGRRSLRARCC